MQVLKNKKKVSIQEANLKFEADFGCSDCKITAGSMKTSEDRKDKILKIISALITVAAVGIFLIYKFF